MSDVSLTTPISIPTIDVIGTPCAIATFEEALQCLRKSLSRARPFLVDITNTHVVALRRRDRAFREATERVDLFLPDSQVLRFFMGLAGGKGGSCHYGPLFLPRVVQRTLDCTHAFVGGDGRVVAELRRVLPSMRCVYEDAGVLADREAEIIGGLLRTEPDFVWLGLGTPRQQVFASRLAGELSRGVIVPVGFAFDVVSSAKRDIPPWLRRVGLGWCHRLATDPTRLAPRYLKYGGLFLWYFSQTLFRARASAGDRKGRRP